MFNAFHLKRNFLAEINKVTKVEDGDKVKRKYLEDLVAPLELLCNIPSVSITQEQLQRMKELAYVVAVIVSTPAPRENFKKISKDKIIKGYVNQSELINALDAYQDHYLTDFMDYWDNSTSAYDMVKQRNKVARLNGSRWKKQHANATMNVANIDLYKRATLVFIQLSYFLLKEKK